MISSEQPTRALITGASSGIGLELARQFAAKGHDLILVARSVDKLNQIASELGQQHRVDAAVIGCDLAQPGAAVRLMESVDQRQLSVDWLVNNAGFGAVGDVAELALDRQSAMVQVNVNALTELTKLAVGAMLKQNGGGVLNVASTAAFQPGPGMAVYYATKSYVLSFSEALHEELRGTGVNVCCLCPGPTRTGFGKDSGMNKSVLFRLGAMDATSVAAAGYAGLMNRRPIVITGLKNKLAPGPFAGLPAFSSAGSFIG